MEKLKKQSVMIGSKSHASCFKQQCLKVSQYLNKTIIALICITFEITTINTININERVLISKHTTLFRRPYDIYNVKTTSHGRQNNVVCVAYNKVTEKF